MIRPGHGRFAGSSAAKRPPKFVAFRLTELVTSIEEAQSGSRGDLTPGPHTTDHTGLPPLRSGHAEVASQDERPSRAAHCSTAVPVGHMPGVLSLANGARPHELSF
jgi:hypothetical protein